MTKFYKKRNGTFVEVSEYDSDLMAAMPVDTATLTITKEGSVSRKYNVDIAIAPLLAGSMLLEDELSVILSKATEAKRSNQKQLTKAENKAWENLITVGGESFRSLQYDSIANIASEISSHLTTKMSHILEDPTCNDAYTAFQLAVKLKLEKNNIV